MTRFQLVSAASLVLGIASGVYASPIFLIDGGPKWQAALDGGRVSAIPNYADIEPVFPGRSGDFVVPTLTVQANSLVVDLGANPNPLGGIEYVYGVDPDLNGKKISYKADPGASEKIRIMLVDQDDSRTPPTTYKSFAFTAPAGGGQANLNFPADATDPASIGADSITTDMGFRLSHVVKILYVDSTSSKKVITDEINVSPEPGAILLAGLAAIGAIPLTNYRLRFPRQVLSA
jgi:hypothetical protein